MHGPFTVVRNAVKMRVRPFRRIYETMEQKALRRKLPMSPVTIYKPQITSLISITHRISGVFLGCSNIMFGLNAIFNPYDFSHIITMVEGFGLSDGSLFVMRTMLAYPMSYHVSTGLRHLLWATGQFLTLKEVYITGYTALASSFLLAATLAMM